MRYRGDDPEHLDRFLFLRCFRVFPDRNDFVLRLQPRIGGPAAASVAAHVQAPLIGLGLAFIAVHLLAVPLGVWWSYLIGLGLGVGWNVLLWLARQQRRRLLQQP